MKFSHSDGQSGLGPPDWFTGIVYIDSIRNPDEQSAVGCACPVHPRRSHRLAHPSQGPDPLRHRRHRAGRHTYHRAGDLARDVVYLEPGEEHWHGATPDRFMAHVAIQEADENGQVVTGSTMSPTRNTTPD